MSAEGRMAGGLRAFLLAAAVLLCASNQAIAGTVKLDFQGVLNNAGVYTGGNNTANPTTRGGMFEWKVLTGGTSTNFTVGSTIWTYCINVNYNLQDPDTYNLTNNLAALPTPGSPMLGTNADKLRILGNEIGTGSYVASREAIQLAVWKIANAASTASMTSATSGVTAAANLLLSHINNLHTIGYNYAGITFVTLGLDSLNPNGGQDQIFWTNNPNLIQEVPVPTGVVLAGMGVVCLGGVNLLRRRKVAVTA